MTRTDGLRIVSLYSGASKRGAERLRTLMPARLSWPGAERPLDGTIRNISETGAKVLVQDVDALPSEFDLDIAEMQVAVRVVVMWRRSGYLGVTFVGAPRSMTGANGVPGINPDGRGPSE